MYSVSRSFKKFNIDNSEDVSEYEEILNDPLCTIITERIEKVREETYDGDTGMRTSSKEELWKLVTWDEKILLV
jgi:hypothetical protein